MKQIALLLIGVFTFLLLQPIAALQVADRSGGIYMTTLDGSIYFLDPDNQDNALIQVYDFDLRTDRLAMNLSDDARLIAYAINRDDSWAVGIGETIDWQLAEVQVNRGSEVAGVSLNWLPKSHQVIVTYIGRDENNRTIVVGRDLLIYTPDEALELLDFPYECRELVAIRDQHLGLQCRLNEDTDDTLTPYVIFAFASGEVFQQDNSAEVLIEVDTILQRNWIWSENAGVLLFNLGVNDFPRGFHLVSQDTRTVSYVHVDVSSATRFTLSPEGSRFLFESAQTGIWTIYDFQAGVPITTFTLENVHRLPGVVWYTEGRFVYATYDDEANKSTLFIQSVLGEQSAYEVPDIIVEISILE